MRHVELAREIPSLNDVLMRADIGVLLARYPRDLVVCSAREVMGRLRQPAMRHNEADFRDALAKLGSDIAAEIERECRPSLRSVVNASGVILHTNLGRAPLGARAIRHIAEVAAGYSNLELSLETGERSRRDDHAESLLLRLLRLKGTITEGRACVVVNNCAAATFLVLNTMAAGGEVIVSRGELVEIGGGFRVPDILSKSNAFLKEVGTTNRTRLADYERAITQQTRLILRVHQSNFRMEGFTERPALAKLVELSVKRDIPLFEDQGTGCVAALEDHGVTEESSFLRSTGSGATVVAASGDKLLGGPQCGLIFGTAEVVEEIRRNPLIRALRVDKLTYAALEATLIDYLTGNLDGIPVTRMIALRGEDVRERCEALAGAIENEDLQTKVIPSRSVIGGGTTPGATLASYAVAIRHKTHSVEALAAMLRQLNPPIIGRIKDEQVLLDLRTVPPEADEVLLRHLNSGLSN